MAAFTHYDYKRHEYVAVQGTEDFVEAAHGDGGEAYSWSEIGVYYSPSARRYFWLSDSGCSCTSFGEYVESVEDFSNGEREDALRAAREWAEHDVRYYPGADHSGLLDAIRDYRPGVQK